jgi:hypothetical protein
MANDLESQQQNNVSGILGRTIRAMTEGMTGMAASKKEDLVLSAGHILQRLRGGRFLSTLREEWNSYKRRGRISDDFEQSEENWDCLQELLDFIDKDIPDTKRLDAMKNLYLNIAVHADSPRPDFLVQQLMRLCRSLGSGELIVLLTAYNMPKSKQDEARDRHHGNWLIAIANESGMPKELVQTYEEGLMQKRLLTQRLHADRSGVILGDHFGLSELAVTLCRWIAEPPKQT